MVHAISGPLEELELSSFQFRCPAGRVDSSGRHRHDVVPMIFAPDQPAKPQPRVVKEVFFPRIAHALERDAPLHESNRDELAFRQLTARAQGKDGLLSSRLQRLQERELALVNVQERAAVGTGDALRLVWGAQFERAATLRTRKL